MDVFLEQSSTNLSWKGDIFTHSSIKRALEDVHLPGASDASLTHLRLILDQCFYMLGMFYFPWVIRGASLLVVRGTGGASLQYTCSRQSYSDDPIKASCNEKVCRGKTSLLAGLWSVLIFQARLVLHIFSQRICAGSGVSFRLHLHIKAPFLFPSKGRMVIFLQSRNPEFFWMWSFEDASAALLFSTKELVSWCRSNLMQLAFSDIYKSASPCASNRCACGGKLLCEMKMK